MIVVCVWLVVVLLISSGVFMFWCVILWVMFIILFKEGVISLFRLIMLVLSCLVLFRIFLFGIIMLRLVI